MELCTARCVFYKVNMMQIFTEFFIIIISALHVSGCLSAHHQELIKLYMHLWVLSCFPAVYCCCGWVGTASVNKFITVLTHEHSEVNKYHKGVNITGVTVKYIA